MRLKHALQALGLASLVAIGGVTVQPALVSATDPVPAADPSPSPDPSPSATPDPSATPAPTPSPTATATPVATAATTTTVAARRTLTSRQRIVRIALRQRYDRYVPGAVGPNAFDCSGLVRFVYRQAGVSRKLGGGHSARMMYLWGRRHHLTGRLHPRLGDVAVWGRGSHVGIYIGNGRVISALNPRQDIRVTRVHALGDPFTTYIHTRLP